MELKLYNTLSQRVEEFKSFSQQREVKMYVCGLTPYDYAHIGHARTAVFFDVLRRVLSYIGYKVIYVHNFTDVDDKIIKKAIKERKKYYEISRKYEKAYLEDLEALNIIKPDVMPRVSDHIKEITTLINILLKKGYAYRISDGIYFHVPMFKEYGKLSHQSLDELNKHRIEPNPEKKDIKDFALWKYSKEEDYSVGAVFRGEGIEEGRPGWHIECSAMSMKYLGETIDIHGGGKDLIFPHHENEIAQSESATGKQFARFWVHVHFVNIKGEKMSKSLQNFIRIRDALKIYAPSTLRLFLLSSHYRKDLDYNEKIMELMRKIDREIRRGIAIMMFEFQSKNPYLEREDKHRESIKRKLISYQEEFINSLLNDMHTEKAISLMRELVEYFINTYQEYCREGKDMERQLLHHFYDVIGVMNTLLGVYKEDDFNFKIGDEVLMLLKKREEKRKYKKFDEADEIRKKIEEKGFMVEDIFQKSIAYPQRIVRV